MLYWKLILKNTKEFRFILNLSARIINTKFCYTHRVGTLISLFMLSHSSSILIDHKTNIFKK